MRIHRNSNKATNLFEEEGKTEKVAENTGNWFLKFFIETKLFPCFNKSLNTFLKRELASGQTKLISYTES
jgi:hypothetical protein